ncbi:MAG: DUF2190 family protein [Planctomycetota bacterium]
MSPWCCFARLTLTAPYARVAGEGALGGSLFGGAVNDVANGAEGEFAIVGVFDLTRETGRAPDSLRVPSSTGTTPTSPPVHGRKVTDHWERIGEACGVSEDLSN